MANKGFTTYFNLNWCLVCQLTLVQTRSILQIQLCAFSGAIHSDKSEPVTLINIICITVKSELSRQTDVRSVHANIVFYKRS